MRNPSMCEYWTIDDTGTRFHGAYYLTVFKPLSNCYRCSFICHNDRWVDINHRFRHCIDLYIDLTSITISAIEITTIVSVLLFSSEPRKPNVVQCGATVVDYPAVQLNRCSTCCSTCEAIDRGRCGDE